MNRIILVLVSLLTVIVGTAFDIQSNNGKAGYTGSPSESTCRNCHNSFTNSGAGTILFNSNLPGITSKQYIPGATYQMSVVVKFAGRGLFGVGLEALTTTGANAGTIVVTNSMMTTTKNATVGANSRKSLTHTLNGGAHTDSSVFAFNWTAPTTNIGNVTFYYAGVMANNDGNPSGDYVANGNTVVTPGSATGINEIANSNNALNVFTLPSERKLHVSFSTSENSNAEIALFDMNGKEVTHLNAGKIHSGDVSLEMNLPQQITNGVYIVIVRAGSLHLSTKTPVML